MITKFKKREGSENFHSYTKAEEYQMFNDLVDAVEKKAPTVGANAGAAKFTAIEERLAKAEADNLELNTKLDNLLKKLGEK